MFWLSHRSRGQSLVVATAWVQQREAAGNIVSAVGESGSQRQQGWEAASNIVSAVRKPREWLVLSLLKKISHLS